MNWELICQQKQKQINKDNISKNLKRVEHDYNVGDDFMLDNHAAYKYGTPYKGPFLTMRCWTNGTVTLQYVPTKIGMIYVGLIHIHLIQILKILTLKICMTISTYDCQLYTFLLH